MLNKWSISAGWIDITFYENARWTNLFNTFMQAIPKGELHSCIEGKRQENKSKNRYTTIFPCKFHWWPIDKDSNQRDSNYMYSKSLSIIRLFAIHRWSLSCCSPYIYNWIGLHKCQLHRGQFTCNMISFNANTTLKYVDHDCSIAWYINIHLI